MRRRAPTVGVLGAVLAALHGGASPALAQDPAAWQAVHEALLVDALGGDRLSAASRYEQLVRIELPAGDPSLSLALFWLGHARWVVGDLAGAREALDRCIRTGLDRARCLDLRSRIDLEAEAIHDLPVVWSFADADDHGVFHPRTFWDQGAVRLSEAADGEDVLAWSTRIDPLRPDELVVGFRDPTPRPREIRWTLRSLEVEATLEIVLFDLEGHAYVVPPGRTRLPVRETVQVVLDLSDARPTNTDAPPLDPARLHRMVVRDLTGLSGQLGRNELEVLALVVR